MSFKEKLSNAYASARFKCKQNAPTIMMVSGIVGFIGTVALAIRATIKSTDVIEVHNAQLFECNNNLSDVEEKKEKGEILPSLAEEAISDLKSDKRKIYLNTTKELVKNYAPVAATGAASICLLLGSHKILNGRYVGVVAAYTGLDHAFRNYRDRVVERYGKNADEDLRNGTHTEFVKTVTKNSEGEEKTVKLAKEVITESEARKNESIYVKYLTRKNFDSWDDDPSYVSARINQVMYILNDRLVTRHAVLLNEAYELLGFTPTKAGMTVGWIYIPEGKNSRGDNFVQISAHPITMFMEDSGEYETAYVLDFNVDGCIDDLYEEAIVHECEVE